MMFTISGFDILNGSINFEDQRKDSLELEYVIQDQKIPD